MTNVSLRKAVNIIVSKKGIIRFGQQKVAETIVLFSSLLLTDNDRYTSFILITSVNASEFNVI